MGAMLFKGICAQWHSHVQLFVTTWTVALWEGKKKIHEIFPGKNTGVGCHFLFQGIFPTQGFVWNGHVQTVTFKMDNKQGHGTWTLFNVVWQPGWEGSLGKNGYMYTYG